MVNFSNVAVIRPSSKVVQVPGSSSSRTRGGGGFKDIADYFDTIQDDIENKRLLKEVGLEPRIVDNMDSATLTAAAQQVGLNRVTRQETTFLNNLLGKDIAHTAKNITEVADTQFQGFSFKEDNLRKEQFRLQDLLLKAGHNPEQVLAATTPNEGETLAAFLDRNKDFTGVQPSPQDLRDGFEGPITGGDRGFVEPTFDDREMFGETTLNNVQSLINNTANGFGNDLEGLGRYANSNTFKQQLTQAQARDRDVVSVEASRVAARVGLDKETFKVNLDLDKDVIIRERNVIQQKNKEIREEDRDLKKEERVERKAKRQLIRETREKMTLSIFNRLENERVTMRTEKRLAKAKRVTEDIAEGRHIRDEDLREEIKIAEEYRAEDLVTNNNRIKGEAMSKLEALFMEQIDEKVPRDKAIDIALKNLMPDERVHINEQQIKRLVENGVVLLDVYNTETGFNEKVEIGRGADGFLDPTTKRVVGLSKAGLGDRLFKAMETSTRAKFQKALYDSELASIQLNQIQEYVDSGALELLTTFGALDFWLMKKQDRMGLIGPDRQAKLRLFTQMQNLVGRVFTAFRKDITGVAGPPEEFERLEEISLSISKLGPTGFRAALDLMKDIRVTERLLLEQHLEGGGFKTAAGTDSFRRGQAERVQRRIDDLQQDYPEGYRRGTNRFNAKRKAGKLDSQKPTAHTIRNPLNDALNFLNRG